LFSACGNLATATGSPVEQGETQVPQTGTLAALKELFKVRRTVTASTILTPADIGRTIMVNNTGAPAIVITLPVIPGIPPSAAGVNDGVAALGEGAAICIVQCAAGAGGVSIVLPVPVRPPAAAADTFNVAQAGPVALGGINQWAIFVSDGSPTNPGDWMVIRGP
jgi:hypothetical protein